MNSRPIKTETEYDRALAKIDKLWIAKPDTPKGDRLDVLITLVEAYESRHHPIDSPDPVDAIKFRMEQQELSRNDLVPILGSRSRVSEVLNRKRTLSLAMIRYLHQQLQIPLASLANKKSEPVPCIRL